MYIYVCVYSLSMGNYVVSSVEIEDCFFFFFGD